MSLSKIPAILNASEDTA